MFSVLTLAVMLADPSQCEAIAKLTLPNTTVTSARWGRAAIFPLRYVNRSTAASPPRCEVVRSRTRSSGRAGHSRICHQCRRSGLARVQGARRQAAHVPRLERRLDFAGQHRHYHEAIVKAMGRGQNDWVRLFMVPGMGHCQGGPGPDQINWMAALERWREGGKAPERIQAARVAGNRVETTRPLCPYPQVAKYIGTGSANDAENFVCAAK